MSSLQAVVASLGSWHRDSSPLIGLFESRELEFKTMIHLASPAEKAEFAKNIAGMANSGGGLIVIGIETQPDAAAGRDRSIRLRPLAPGTLLVKQLEDVARSWVYPPRRRLDIQEWLNDSGQMLVSILVPSHDDPSGLVLVLGPGDPPDRRTLGVPVRSDSRIDFHNASEVYEWIRRGRLQVEAPVTDEGGIAPRDEADEQLSRVRAEFLDVPPAEEALFVLQAWSTISTRLEGIHDQDRVRGLFLNPPKQRWAGFGWWGRRPEVDAGGGLRVSTGEVTLWVTPSAVATLVVSQNYLTYAMERHSGTPLINSIALGEVTWEFARTYMMLLDWADPRPQFVSFRVGLFRALEPLALRLGSGRADGVGYSFDAHDATVDEWVDEVGPIEVAGETGTGERIAARLLRRIYGMFGFGREAIPHLVDDGERFDPTLLVK